MHGALATLKTRIQVLWSNAPRTAYFKAAHELNPELEIPLRRQPSGAHPPTALLAGHSENSVDVTLSLNGIPVATAGAEKPAYGPMGRGCAPTIQGRSRSARAHLRIQATHVGALRGRHRLGAHDHPPGGSGNALSSLQQGVRRSGWKSTRSGGAELPHGLPLGGGTAARQPARPSRPLHPFAD